MTGDGLTWELVSETSREGDLTLWRAEVRRDGTLVDASAFTTHPRVAIADALDLVAEHADDLPDAKPFHDEALRNLTAA
jgi:hypothetical protein